MLFTHKEIFFEIPDSDFRIAKDKNNEFDEMLCGSNVFNKTYQSISPSIIELKEGVYHPLVNRGKVIATFGGRVVHCQMGGKYDTVIGCRLEDIVGARLQTKRVPGVLIDLTSDGSSLFSFWLLEALPKLKLV